MKNTGIILWSAFESVLKFVVFRVLHIEMREDTWDKFIQFVKFAMVGFSNVIVSYGVYLIFFALFQIAGILPNTDRICAEYFLVVLLESEVRVCKYTRRRTLVSGSD